MTDEEIEIRPINPKHLVDRLRKVANDLTIQYKSTNKHMNNGGAMNSADRAWFAMQDAADYISLTVENPLPNKISDEECDFCGNEGPTEESFPRPGLESRQICTMCASSYSVSAWLSEMPPSPFDIAKDIQLLRNELHSMKKKREERNSNVTP